MSLGSFNLLTTSPWRSTPESYQALNPTTLKMSRLRIYPGDDGDAERDREAQWASLPPTRIAVQGPGDSAWQFNGRAFIHLRCNCRTQRDHGFDRCNRHISTRDHQNGYRYCFQCREHCAVTEANSFEAAMQMRRNWRRMQPATPLTDVEAAFYTRRIFRDGIRDAPQDCHCDCAGCLGPELPPTAPVVDMEPPSKRVRRS